MQSFHKQTFNRIKALRRMDGGGERKALSSVAFLTAMSHRIGMTEESAANFLSLSPNVASPSAFS